MKTTVYLYVFDTMADWEPGYAVAEINSGRMFRKDAPKLAVKTVGASREPVLTMGGVRIAPDIALDECSDRDAAALILPGGETWLDASHDPILAKAREFLSRDIPVAAICGATIALARTGLLNDRPHTSNSLEYLQQICPEYNGAALYRNEAAVTGGKLVTAPGSAPLEFAFHLLKLLDVVSSRALEAWYKLYTTREMKYYLEVVEALKE